MDAVTNIKDRSRHVTEGRTCASHAAVATASAVAKVSADASNAAPHLPVITNPCSAQFDLIDDTEIFAAKIFKKIFKKTPCAAGLKPGGRYVAKDIHEISGISLLMNTLLDNGHLRGDCITAKGRTIAENLKSVRPNAASDGVVGPKGNVAPEGAVVKVAGMSKLKLSGSAHRFGPEENALGGPNVKLTGADAPQHETKWHPRATNHTLGALWNDAQQVGPATDGAVPHPGGAHEKQCYAGI
ncbi:dihydroxy-acid dehydratase [Bradyrhizobium sp. LjRoot220]|uniref:dihydroxy-acid dehydratase domain-containing protein n=1 Tax=Bradyrhizobium sp. LjRoot220 TaxID=3342284 RepID=UPI003ED02DB6